MEIDLKEIKKLTFSKRRPIEETLQINFDIIKKEIIRQANLGMSRCTVTDFDLQTHEYFGDVLKSLIEIFKEKGFEAQEQYGCDYEDEDGIEVIWLKWNEESEND